MIISLTGFMGCGKSSVGRRLSELLCCPFMDLDEIIEARTGRSIPEIFATDGEDAFRKMEKSELQTHLSDHQRRVGRSLRSPHHCASLVVPPLPCRGWHGLQRPPSAPGKQNYLIYNFSKLFSAKITQLPITRKYYIQKVSIIADNITFYPRFCMFALYLCYGTVLPALHILGKNIIKCFHPVCIFFYVKPYHPYRFGCFDIVDSIINKYRFFRQDA